VSRVTKALREWWAAPPRPRGWGQVVTVRHAFYGPIRLFRWDEGISQHLFDGQTVWEPEVVEIFAREWVAGRNAIDAGANLGLHSIALAKLAARGAKVYAIEPHPEVFPLTRANCRRFAAVTCIKAAASDRLRTVSMPRLRRGGNAAIATVSDAAAAGCHAVRAVTIDSLGLTNVGFIKIDTEGHELACLRGAAETIRRDRPTLLVEICGGHDLQTASPKVAATIRASIAEIEALGYAVEQVSSHDYLCRPRAASA